MSPPLFRVFQAIRMLGTPTCGEIFAALKNGHDRTLVNKYVRQLVAMKVIKKAGEKDDYPPRYEAV